MERRQEERSRQRVPCELAIGARRYTGMVLDLAARGLFVQSIAKAPPGTAVAVQLALPGLGKVQVAAEVARRYTVPGHLRSVARGGLGLRVVSADDAFYDYLEPEPGTRDA